MLTRNILVLFCLLFCLSGYAQKRTYTLEQLVPIDSTTGDIVYTGVVEVPGVSAADLYSRAKTYYLKTFNNANAVIQLDEPGQRVGGKGTFTLPMSRKTGPFSPPMPFMTTIEIRVKDGRYRYEFSQFTMRTQTAYPQDFPALPMFKKAYGRNISEKAADGIKAWDEAIIDRVADLYRYMTAKTGDKNDF